MLKHGLSYLFCFNFFRSITCTADWRHRGIQSVSAATMAMVEEKARVVLARSERAALSQLLADYRTRRISVEDLVTRLADLLNTHEKLTLLTELRELVDSKDRAAFDELVYRPRVPSARVWIESTYFFQITLKSSTIIIHSSEIRWSYERPNPNFKLFYLQLGFIFISLWPYPCRPFLPFQNQECKQMDLIVSPSIHQLSVRLGNSDSTRHPDCILSLFLSSFLSLALV